MAKRNTLLNKSGKPMTSRRVMKSVASAAKKRNGVHGQP